MLDRSSLLCMYVILKCSDELEYTGFGYLSDDGENSQSVMQDKDLFAEPVYPGAELSVAGAYVAIMEFKRKCKLPFTQL